MVIAKTTTTGRFTLSADLCPFCKMAKRKQKHPG